MPLVGKSPTAVQGLFGRQRRTCGANQFVRFDENVTIVRLLSCKKADGYKRSAKQQACQHNFPVGAFVSVME
jgi:hypothetical protein